MAAGGEALTQPLVPVQPDPDLEGRVGADEAGAEVAVPDVEVDVLGEGACPSWRELPDLALQLAWRPKDVGLLLGDADQDQALGLSRGRSLEVGLRNRLLALSLCELDHRDVLLLGQRPDRGYESPRHLAQDLIARDLLAPVPTQEPGQVLWLLEAGDRSRSGRCDRQIRT